LWRKVSVTGISNEMYASEDFMTNDNDNENESNGNSNDSSISSDTV
jgi:hypothetical protein